MLDDINIVGGSIHTLKKNNEALVITSIETGLEVNSEKTKDKIMSQNEHAGKTHNIKISKKPSARVEQLKYLGTNQNSILEELKIRMNSGNICYHSVQNLLPYNLLSINIKIRHRDLNFASYFVWV
jgi:hypothetical protein